jgi:hypothetical protein
MRTESFAARLNALLISTSSRIQAGTARVMWERRKRLGAAALSRQARELLNGTLASPDSLSFKKSASQHLRAFAGRPWTPSCLCLVSPERMT